jgi:hypothetical protein
MVNLPVWLPRVEFSGPTLRMFSARELSEWRTEESSYRNLASSLGWSCPRQWPQSKLAWKQQRKVLNLEFSHSFIVKPYSQPSFMSVKCRAFCVWWLFLRPMSQVNFPQLVPCFDLKYNYKITASAMVVSHDLSNTSLLPFLRLDLLSNLVLHEQLTWHSLCRTCARPRSVEYRLRCNRRWSSSRTRRRGLPLGRRQPHDRVRLAMSKGGRELLGRGENTETPKRKERTPQLVVKSHSHSMFIEHKKRFQKCLFQRMLHIFIII